MSYLPCLTGTKQSRWCVRFLHSIMLFIDLGLHDIAVKAVTAAQLSMASTGVYRVTLDEAIEAMRLTAADMSVKYKETSLSVRQKLVRISFLTQFRI